MTDFQPWEQAWRSTPIPPAQREAGTRYHRAPAGRAACFFRQGFARGGRDALRRLYRELPEEHRGLVSAIAADYEDDADD